MEYITIEDGVITGHFDAVEVPGNGVEVSDFRGTVGMPTTLFNEDWSLKTAEELVTDGVLEDNRGTYFSKVDGSEFEITEIGAPLPDEYTDSPPVTFYDEWNETSGAWETNEVIKAAAEKQQAIDATQNEVDAELAEACNAIIRWMEERFTVPQTDFDFVATMTDIGDVQTAVTGILNKLNLDAGDLTFIESWKTKYDAWVAAKG